MKVIKPLYGIPEAGTHWFHTYDKHQCEKLSMTLSSYDPCFLISSKPGAIRIVGLQTDDTLFLGDQDFANLEVRELKNAKLTAKDLNELSPDQPLIFNGCKLVMVKGGINLFQKNQADRIKLIDPFHNAKRTYLEQRACGAYLATICQPEASYSLSIAAQCQEPGINEISLLNKQLKWQLQNKDRGI
ncbi:hypothetical protein EV44_g3371 [Erysiphe necator]|uniref:Uncharacterized protein n=1 Tax=Uncinula necator TaxID=52586 RepID=A0A0B1PAI8_UNCNE|nr:hypothetical protein EV44_g3371 [Erysiphe necator]